MNKLYITRKPCEDNRWLDEAVVCNTHRDQLPGDWEYAGTFTEPCWVCEGRLAWLGQA